VLALAVAISSYASINHQSASLLKGSPLVVPIPDDKRYRSWKTEPEPVANAVIV
jgi:hypothetical protein